MARHTVQVTPHEKGTSGEAERPDASVESVGARHDSSATLGCPVNTCDGRLKHEASGYDSQLGLESMVCPRCGHRGFRSRDGVILLFRGGYEFKFSYGPSVQTITIVLSSAAVNLWGTHNVHEEQLAKIAAEWALLCGRTGNSVHLGIPAEEFADFYLYFCKS